MAPRVEVRAGVLEGALSDDGALASFRGIPYAGSTAGARRFAPPVPAEPWSGVRDARRHGPSCPQPSSRDDYSKVVWHAHGLRYPGHPWSMSEDCLSLAVDCPWPRPAEPLPVMLWIHGGSHRHGTAAKVDTRALARLGVVVVSINYRLGPLGFLAHPALSAESPEGVSGNAGLLDPIAALGWVRDDIAAFGGDPGRVTLFGHSAGAHSVCALLVSPLAAGLFHRAVALSGIGTHHFVHLKPGQHGRRSAEELGERFAKHLGIGGSAEAQLAALRAHPVDALVEASATFPARGRFGPPIDGHVLPRHIGQAVERGDAHPVPVVLGATADEGSLLWWGAPLPNAPLCPHVADYESAVRRYFAGDAERALALYPASDDVTMHASSKRMLGESLFVAPARYLATELSKRGHPVYHYSFSHRPPSPAAEHAGSYHVYDVDFAHGSLRPELHPRPSDQALSRALMRYLAGFAHSGDPNGEGLPVWERYDRARDRTLELSERLGMRAVVDADRLDLLEAALRREMATLPA